MTPKCKFCRERAIYLEQRLCPEHLAKFVERRVDKVFSKILGLENKKILMAISGGKDSIGLAHILSKKNLNLELLYIHLGIPVYSDSSQKAVEDFSKKHKLKLHIIRLGDSGFTVEDFHKNQLSFKTNTCSLCGSAKRYLFNKFANENDFDFIVTAHNLDDFSAFAVMGISSGDLSYISKISSISWPQKELKTVGRIRPYFYVPERASLLYTLSNNLQFFEGECEHSQGNKQPDIKTGVSQIEKITPGFRQHLVKFTKKSSVPLTSVPKNCKSCGYPSAIDVCRFCRIKEQLGNKI